VSRIVIDGPGIRALASNPNIVREFPFLRKYTAPPVPGCCGAPDSVPNPNPALDALTRLPGTRIKILKELLGVDIIVVWVVRAAQSTKIEL
jgi:hypothetical protein